MLKPYVEVEQGLNTVVIDVTDCEALAQLHPTLSVQLENCSEDVNAVKVTIDGSEISAQWDAQTCTAAFEPVSGGRYVITAYVDTEQEPDDGDDNTGDDNNDDNDEQPVRPSAPGTNVYPDYGDKKDDEPVKQQYAVS